MNNYKGQGCGLRKIAREPLRSLGLEGKIFGEPFRLQDTLVRAPGLPVGHPN